MHYACINVCFWRFSWSSLSLATVASEGTHPEGEGACRSYYKKSAPEGTLPLEARLNDLHHTPLLRSLTVLKQHGLVICIISGRFEAPQVRLHGLFAAREILLRVEGCLVG